MFISCHCISHPGEQSEGVLKTFFVGGGAGVLMT